MKESAFYPKPAAADLRLSAEGFRTHAERLQAEADGARRQADALDEGAKVYLRRADEYGAAADVLESGPEAVRWSRAIAGLES